MKDILFKIAIAFVAIEFQGLEASEEDQKCDGMCCEKCDEDSVSTPTVMSDALKNHKIAQSYRNQGKKQDGHVSYSWNNKIMVVSDRSKDEVVNFSKNNKKRKSTDKGKRMLSTEKDRIKSVMQEYRDEQASKYVDESRKRTEERRRMEEMRREQKRERDERERRLRRKYLPFQG